MEYHSTELAKACRVCGKRLNKSKGQRNRSFLVAEHTKDLMEVFSIDSSTDSMHIHPPSFCLSCRVFMTTWRSRATGTPAVSRVYIWEPHTEPDCRVSRVLNILKITDLIS